MTQPELVGDSQPTQAVQAEDYDVSQREEVQKLRKHAVGLGGVLFLTVTGAAPISAMLFNVPIMVGFGQGSRAATSSGVRSLLGSVAHEVVHKSPLPVLVVPEKTG